ncbi:alpha/beta hydrolase [Flavobacterium circumlabens]|uniref:Alpha/beta hydrolase n=1 Tax=Flavobacterium circumlabens TaxID=2133765 RepID=A0A4Y7U7X9_9FLAO|nr:alpha/beta hydrolase [Flavobacterium circumlabens]TCN53121.1 pimeloyl-ACP methyl ester carboxylesterase [Flavobacterium circumlabens]TEB42331.1 alpha/beta hydrolase [Flavobacterium circumlabens]
MYRSNTKTIVFISGAFVSHHYWEQWIVFFESKGYKAVAPPWLHKNDTAENLRKQNLNSKTGAIRLSELLCYYKEIIEILPEKPILIGHSYGGLIVQLLIQQDLASAGICINSFPPAGCTVSKCSFYKNIFRFSYSLFSDKKTFFLSFKKWQHVYFNTNSAEKQKTTYEKFLIPESKRAFRDLFLENTTINFKRKHVPLFFISASEDKIISSKLVYWNFRKYKNFHSLTCYREVRNKSHFVILDCQWEETAQHSSQWLKKIFS